MADGAAIPEVRLPPKLRPLFEPHRYKVLYGGRGSAKSWSIARALVLLGASRSLRILCAREIQDSIRESVHRLLCDQIAALGLGSKYQILDKEIRGRRNSTLFVFDGLAEHTVESIKSYEGIDIVWVEEARNVSAKSWDVLTPTIRKPGSEVWISFNPELDTDETYVRFVSDPPPNAWVCELNWRDNPHFTAELEAERQETRRKRPEDYDKIWEGKPQRVASGAIYAAEVQAMYDGGRVCRVPHDPVLVVDTVWDLGWNDSMSVGVYQRAGSELRGIGYIEDSHRTLDWYVAELKRKWPSVLWGKDFIPHDGASRDFKTGKSTEDLLKGMGRTVEVLEMLPVEEGIRAVRTVLPRMVIDQGSAEDQKALKNGTPRLLECLKRYRRTINKRTAEPGAPLHDEYSHGCDMVRYTAQAVERMGVRHTPPPVTVNPIGMMIRGRR